MVIETTVTLQKFSFPIVGGVTTEKLESSIDVWCQCLGVKRSEFYLAAQAGISADAVFRVWQFEYNGEQRLICGNDTYTVKRSYPVDTDHVELVCQRRTGR